MPAGFTGLDPLAVSGFAAALRAAADGWRRWEHELTAGGRRFDLSALVAGPCSDLAAVADLVERAAADLDARAALAEAVDRGDWSAVERYAAEIVATERVWEGATPGGPDEGTSSTWTRTTWADLEARLYGVVTPVASELCAENRWYREAGMVIGPDGQAYPILVPNVRNPDARDEADTFVFNDDWGAPADAGVTTLLGADARWETVAVETGAGRLGDDPGGLATLLIGAAGPAGARFLDATGRHPVPLAVYDNVGLDSSWVPDRVPYGDRAEPEPDPVDAPDEVAGVVPEMMETAGGHVRYEATVPASVGAVLAAGAVDLVGYVSAGTGNVRTVQDRRNIGYAVEYQVNDDGRTRAVARGYQLTADDDGEIHVSMGYLGVTEHGPGPVGATAPRINDGYGPTFDTNGVPGDL